MNIQLNPIFGGGTDVTDTKIENIQKLRFWCEWFAVFVNIYSICIQLNSKTAE